MEAKIFLFYIWKKNKKFVKAVELETAIKQSCDTKLKTTYVTILQLLGTICLFHQNRTLAILKKLNYTLKTLKRTSFSYLSLSKNYFS
jgi:hypothetical protein